MKKEKWKTCATGQTLLYIWPSLSIWVPFIDRLCDSEFCILTYSRTLPSSRIVLVKDSYRCGWHRQPSIIIFASLSWFECQKMHRNFACASSPVPKGDCMHQALAIGRLPSDKFFLLHCKTKLMTSHQDGWIIWGRTGGGMITMKRHSDRVIRAEKNQLLFSYIYIAFIQLSDNVPSMLASFF